jgi:hypothetical protein
MASGGSEPATLTSLREELRNGFGDLKGEFAEVKGEITELRREVREGFADVKVELRSGFADLKVTLTTGFATLPTRELTEEMVRLLRENNRLQEERFTLLDVRIREQHLETQQVLHALAEGQRSLIEGQRNLLEGQRSLSADIRALIARLDALIKGRGDGASSS